MNYIAIFILVLFQSILFMGKLINVIDWPWWCVLLPFEIVFSVTILLLVVIELMILIDSWVLRDDNDE